MVSITVTELVSNITVPELLMDEKLTHRSQYIDEMNNEYDEEELVKALETTNKLIESIEQRTDVMCKEVATKYVRDPVQID